MVSNPRISTCVKHTYTSFYESSSTHISKMSYIYQACDRYKERFKAIDGLNMFFDHEPFVVIRFDILTFGRPKVYYYDLLHNFIMYCTISSCSLVKMFWQLLNVNKHDEIITKMFSNVNKHDEIVTKMPKHFCM